MEKFQIFLSHIAQESAVAVALKEVLEAAFAGAVEVFVSSDRGDLRGGDRWLEQIIQRLKASDAVLVLATPISITRPWVNFEAGGGYLLGKPVIPVMLKGLSFEALPLPLSSLHGVNAATEAGLDDLFKDVSAHSSLRPPAMETVRTMFEKVSRATAHVEPPPEAEDGNGASGSNPDDTPPHTEALNNSPKQVGDYSITRWEDSVAFFSYRMAEAFPGVEGLVWFDDPRTAASRLLRLLRQPLLIRDVDQLPTGPEEYSIDPIWWFRGGLSHSISLVAELRETKILMDISELEIRRVAAYRGSDYHRDFVYVEVGSEPTVGLYGTSQEDIEAWVRRNGYAHEEYGVWQNRPVTRAEYDDGYAAIDGQIVRLHGKALRRRYLSSYNFLVCAKSAPYNSTSFDQLSRKYLNGILKGTRTFDSFLKAVLDLPRKVED